MDRSLMAKNTSKRERFLNAFRFGGNKRSSSLSPPSASSSLRPSTNIPKGSSSQNLHSNPLPAASNNPGLNAKLWQRAQQEVGNDKDWPQFHAKFIQHGPIDGIDSIIAQLQQVRSDAAPWEFSIGGQTIVMREVLDSIVEYAAIFKDVGNTVVACDPTQHAALAWGLVQFVVTAAVKNKAARELVSDYKPVAHMISQCAVYIELYAANDAVSQNTKDSFTSSVQETYVAILRYLVAVWKYMQQNKFGHIWTAVVKPETLQDELNKAQAANATMLKEQNKAQAEVIVDHSDRSRKLEAFITRLGPAFDKISLQMKDLFEHQKSQDLRRMHEETLEKISSFGYHIRYTQILRLRLDSTCQWILDEPSFHEWKDSGSSRILWLCGKMGTGKSTLVATVIESMVSQSQRPFRLAYHFCDGTAQQSQTTDLILGSLLKQLCQFPTVDISKPLIERAENDQAGALRAEECERFLQPLMASHHTTIIIDALDELSKNVCSTLIKSLERLASANTTTTTKIFVSSRPILGLERLLNDYIKLEVLNQHDLNRYIDTRLDEFLETSYVDLNESKPRIRRTLYNQAGGMFRWLQMSFKILSANEGLMTEEDVLKAIKSLPADLEALYDQIYSQIENLNSKTAAMVQRALILLMYSEVPLTTQEILEAVLPAPNTRLKSRENYLIDHCKGLVEWDQSQDAFRLAHATVRSFLGAHKSFSFFESQASLAKMCLSCLEDSLPDGKPAKTFKARTFLSYAFVYWPWHVFYAFTQRFTDSDLRRFFSDDPQTTLTRWTHHVGQVIDAHMLAKQREQAEEETESESQSLHRSSSVTSRSDPGLTTVTASDTAYYPDITASDEEEDRSEKDSTKSHIIDPLVEYLRFLTPNQKEQLSTNDSRVYTWIEFRSQIPNPIWALLYWELICDYIGPSTEIDPKLMEIKRDSIWMTQIDPEGSTHEVQTFQSKVPPISIAARTKSFESIKALSPYTTPSIAKLCYFGPLFSGLLGNQKLDAEQVEELFEEFLTKDCSPDQIDMGGSTMTVLHEVIRERRLTLLKLLLQYNADTEIYSFENLTALHEACRSGGEDTITIIKALLAHGASISASGAYGKTCLHFIAENHQLCVGDVDIIREAVKILIGAGNPINAEDGYGRTPLHLAAAAEQGAIFVQVLVDQGASVNMSDVFGWTPIHYAILPEDDSALQALVGQRSAAGVATGPSCPNNQQMIDVDARDILGATALTIAIVLDRRDHLTTLIDRGASLKINPYGDISLPMLSIAQGYAEEPLLHFISVHWSNDTEIIAILREACEYFTHEPLGPATGLVGLESEQSKQTMSQITPSQLNEAVRNFSTTKTWEKATEVLGNITTLTNIRYLCADPTAPAFGREKRQRLRALLDQLGIEVVVPELLEDNIFEKERLERFLMENQTPEGSVNTEALGDGGRQRVVSASEKSGNSEDDDNGEEGHEYTPNEKALMDGLIGCYLYTDG